MGTLQGDGGLAGGKGAHVVRNGQQAGRDAASGVPGGQVRALPNSLGLFLIQANSSSSLVGPWRRCLRSFKPQSQR